MKVSLCLTFIKTDFSFFSACGAEKTKINFIMRIAVFLTSVRQKWKMVRIAKRFLPFLSCEAHRKRLYRNHVIFNNKKSNRTKADRLTKTFLLAEMDWQIGIWAKYLFPQVTVVLRGHFAI